MVKLGMIVETTHPQSMEEVQKAAMKIHLYSYQNFAMNVEPGTLWNGQSSAVNVEFEEWLCECIHEGKQNKQTKTKQKEKKKETQSFSCIFQHGMLEHSFLLDFMLQTSWNTML